MKNDILEQLKSLKTIVPDADFAFRTKRTVLAIPTPGMRWDFLAAWPKVTLGVAVLAVLVVVLGVPGAPKAVPIASAEALNNEFTNLSINIEVKQISYNQNTNQAIASALSEIGSTKANHLNPAVLEAESQSVDPNVPASNPQIDDLLKQVSQ